MIISQLTQESPHFAQVTEELTSFADRISSRFEWDEKALIADVVKDALNNGVSAKDILGAAVFENEHPDRIYIFWNSPEGMVSWWFDRMWFREAATRVRIRQPLAVVTTEETLCLCHSGELDNEGIPDDWEVLPLDVARALSSAHGWVICDVWTPENEETHEMSVW